MMKESDDQHSVITKDKAYLAASENVAHFKKLRGRQNLKYLGEHFLKTWNQFDEKKKNFLLIVDGNSFMKELMEFDE